MFTIAAGLKASTLLIIKYFLEFTSDCDRVHIHQPKTKYTNLTLSFNSVVVIQAFCLHPEIFEKRKHLREASKSGFTPNSQHKTFS